MNIMESITKELDNYGLQFTESRQIDDINVCAGYIEANNEHLCVKHYNDIIAVSRQLGLLPVVSPTTYTARVVFITQKYFTKVLSEMRQCADSWHEHIDYLQEKESFINLVHEYRKTIVEHRHMIRMSRRYETLIETHDCMMEFLNHIEMLHFSFDIKYHIKFVDGASKEDSLAIDRMNKTHKKIKKWFTTDNNTFSGHE